MKILKIRQRLQRRGLLLIEDGPGSWLVTNEGTPKTLSLQKFADLNAVEDWLAALPNRMTEAEAEVFDTEFEEFVNQCDGCRRGLPLDDDGVHRGRGFDMIGCTRERYRSE